MLSTPGTVEPASHDYDTALVLTIELSNASWVLAAQIPGLPWVKAKCSVKLTDEALMAAIRAFITAYNHTAESLGSTKKNVHQQRFKNRRISQARSGVLGSLGCMLSALSPSAQKAIHVDLS